MDELCPLCQQPLEPLKDGFACPEKDINKHIYIVRPRVVANQPITDMVVVYDGWQVCSSSLHKSGSPLTAFTNYHSKLGTCGLEPALEVKENLPMDQILTLISVLNTKKNEKDNYCIICGEQLMLSSGNGGVCPNLSDPMVGGHISTRAMSPTTGEMVKIMAYRGFHIMSVPGNDQYAPYISFYTIPANSTMNEMMAPSVEVVNNPIYKEDRAMTVKEIDSVIDRLGKKITTSFATASDPRVEKMVDFLTRSHQPTDKKMLN